MNINLHIERLVLDGVLLEASQAPQLKAAVEQELTRLLGEGGAASWLDTGATLARVEAGAVNWMQWADPARLGVQLAGALYGGLGQRR
jgi:hypothetical protein